MKKPSKRPRPTFDDIPLRALIRNAGLDEAYEKLILVTGGPSDGRCMLYVATSLGFAFAARPDWSTTPPFENWDRLAALIRAHGLALKRHMAHIEPQIRSISRKNGTEVVQNAMYGYIDKHPLYAMLCAMHEEKTQKRRQEYASLQMQILFARWKYAEYRAKERELSVEAVLTATGKQHEMRDAKALGKAVRALSTLKLADVLGNFKPIQDPKGFREHIKDWWPGPDGEVGSLFDAIFHHVARSRGPRQVDSREVGERKKPRQPYPEYVEYGSWRIGIQVGRDDEDGFNSQSIYQFASPTDSDDKLADQDREALKKEQDQYLSALDAARKLGVHPAELGRHTHVRSEAAGAHSKRQAAEIARAKGRSIEIDRRLMPWSCDQLSLADFRRKVLPVLENALIDPNITFENLTSATLVAISIDSGRQMRHAIDLRIERQRKRAPFSYEPSIRAKRISGTWNWVPVGPEYDAFFGVPEDMEVNRAKLLQYPASSLVALLIEKYRVRGKIQSGGLFRGNIDYVARAAAWMKGQTEWGDVTPAKLARLRWQVLHQLTNGELAISCLMLGLRAHQASVELHYTVLELSEAREKFEASSSILWGSPSSIGKANTRKAQEAAPAIVGIRAFPRLGVIREVVLRLQVASQAFFKIKPRNFDKKSHRNLLNKAVLYVVWHQFYSFATRAIRDAYQERSIFVRSRDVWLRGVAILSDKDFADGHKTRLIWADERLLLHMDAIEEHFEGIRKRLNGHVLPKDSALFFLDEDGKALRITPKTVVDHLGTDFPFEVNAPRKVMRFLVRKAGLSHEDAEVYMGHWWDAREPWSPFSSLDWHGYLQRLSAVVPDILLDLGFTWIPGEGAK